MLSSGISLYLFPGFFLSGHKYDCRCKNIGHSSSGKSLWLEDSLTRVAASFSFSPVGKHIRRQAWKYRRRVEALITKTNQRRPGYEKGKSIIVKQQRLCSNCVCD
jgi:hypothetical protein